LLQFLSVLLLRRLLFIGVRGRCNSWRWIKGVVEIYSSWSPGKLIIHEIIKATYILPHKKIEYGR
jgi:hypothetical protein